MDWGIGEPESSSTVGAMSIKLTCREIVFPLP